jgi:hypothetical protein
VNVEGIGAGMGTYDGGRWLGRRRFQWGLAMLSLLYAMAILLRVGDLHSPGELVEREFRSAIIARSLYFTLKAPEEAGRVEVAQTSWRREGRLEPPLTEALVSGAYWLTGAERLWLSRILCTSFWLAGGPFLFAIARRQLSPGLARVALGFYLLAPLGVTTSRSFQPDALMILALVTSLHAMLRHAEVPSPARFVWVAVSAGAAIVIKPLVVFMVLFGFAALTLHRRGPRGLMGREAIAFFAFALIPAAAWFSYGALAPSGWGVGLESVDDIGSPGSAVVRQIWMSLVPERVLHFGFWLAWAKLALHVVGPVSLLAGLLGVSSMGRSPERALILGAWASYPVFGFATSGLSADHGYYHLQLIPVVSLGLASLAGAAWAAVPAERRSIVAVAACGLALGWTVVAVNSVRAELSPGRFEAPSVCRAIGDAVNHSTRTVYVARHYGRPLEYLGELSGVPWPKATLPGDAGASASHVEERIGRLNFVPEYFIVTDFDRFERYHAPLGRWLSAHCHDLIAQPDYRIWGRCTRS